MPLNFSSNRPVASLSPIDGTTLWEGQESEPVDIDETMDRSADAGRRWRKVPLDRRIEIVRNYQAFLEAHREEIEHLIVREVGKLRWEAAGEVNASIAKIDLSVQALQQRRSDLLVGPQDATADSNRPAIHTRIRYQPLGVVLVLGPFNFPLHLPGGQIIPAILAGNAVVFKPSEQATAIGHWMVNAWRTAGLAEDLLQMIVGGPDVAAQAIDSPHTSAVFLTGSRAAGRSIHRRLAGRPGVLLALELGGNNPIVIADGVPDEMVASIVSASAFLTAGQRCTCARRAIFVESASTDSQLKRLVARTRSLRVGMPNDTPGPHIGPMISQAAGASLRSTYDKLLGLGCRPVIPWEIESRASNLVRPMIVDSSTLTTVQQNELGKMEWFGPLLVVQRATDFDAAMTAAADTLYGLAAALLGGTEAMFERFVSEIGAGVVNWNGTTTGAAGRLPFGGLGESGNHRPAGFFAIDFCSDPVATIERAAPPTDDPWSVVK